MKFKKGQIIRLNRAASAALGEWEEPDCIFRYRYETYAIIVRPDMMTFENTADGFKTTVDYSDIVDFDSDFPMETLMEIKASNDKSKVIQVKLILKNKVVVLSVPYPLVSGLYDLLQYALRNFSDSRDKS